MDEIFISLDDVMLYAAIITAGTEIETSQDGCYSEYEYCEDIYILRIQNGYLTIEVKEEE